MFGQAEQRPLPCRVELERSFRQRSSFGVKYDCAVFPAVGIPVMKMADRERARNIDSRERIELTIRAPELHDRLVARGIDRGTDLRSMVFRTTLTEVSKIT